MKEIKMIICLTIVGILLSACPDKEYMGHPMTFINKSKTDLIFQYKFVDKNNPSSWDTDTLFQCREVGKVIAVSLRANFIDSIKEGPVQEYDFKHGLSYLEIIMMDGNAYVKYRGAPCDTIRKYVPVLHVYRLKLEDLQKMDWRVMYPPEK